MIFIVVRMTIRPEHADEWMTLVDEFTRATRNEPGNLWFDWSRSVDNPNQYVLTEAFADAAAGVAHVQSEHFKVSTGWMPDVVATTPEIIHVDIPGATGWSEMAEVKPRR